MKGEFRVQAGKTGKKAEILLYSPIGAGWEGGVSAKQFAADLAELGKVDQLTIRINSTGGDTFEGLAIFNALVKHPAWKTVEIDGIAAEIAALIGMAGNEIRMAANAFLMLKNPYKVVAGRAIELRKEADNLDRVRGTMIDTYCRRTNTPRQRVSEWMKNETWFTAEQAKAAGLVGGITCEAKITNFAGLDLTRAKNAPKALVSRIEQGRAVTSFGDPIRQKIAGLKNRILKISLRQSGRVFSSPTHRK